MSVTQLSERVHICRGGVNFAILVGTEKRLILVDSGLDSGAARKALKPFLEDGFKLTAIINTHSHADHIGGNADLLKRTGCEVWAPARERPFILWPELEPLGLYGGAWPPPALQVKFLQAQPTPMVRELPPAPATFQLAGVTMELIPVPGHALDQVAIALDDVLIAADGLFKPEVIEKHPIIFLVNVAEYLSSLDLIAGRSERYVLPGHGDLVDRQAGEGDPLPEILAANRTAIARLQEAVLQALVQPLTAEELLYQVVAAMGKQLDGDPQYFLDRAAVSAHVSDLLHSNRISVAFREGKRLLAK
jgi:glyoxylase-like metal-dependent hydrolase (beta-lactamase superfamily II)